MIAPDKSLTLSLYLCEVLPLIYRKRSSWFLKPQFFTSFTSSLTFDVHTGELRTAWVSEIRSRCWYLFVE
jgi:hypothetical protein